MLVIISDLHLTDGTTNQGIGPDAFALFSERLRDLVNRASWRQDGTYRPVSEVHLLLLGDIFDHLLSTCWLQGEAVNPWDDPQSRVFIERLSKITNGILQENDQSCSLLRKMTEGKLLEIPAAREVQAGEGAVPIQGTPVRIYYMSGNHDWYLHLSGHPYDSIRQKAVDALGLANSIAPFPHKLEEWPELEKVCLEHGVYARHGDIYDPFNYDQDAGRNAATLGDAIVVRLINLFLLRANDQLAGQMSPVFLNNLYEIVNVRPALLVPAWLEGLLHRYCPDPGLVRSLREIWNETADEFLKDPFVKEHNKPYVIDTVDWLALLLRLTRDAPLEFMSKAVMFVSETLWGGDISLIRYALQEKAFTRNKARYIVYGHTHQPQAQPMGVFDFGNSPLGQYHFNSGTWHSVHEVTRRNPRQLDFVSQRLMTYLVFYKDDERKGYPYETWSGTLASPRPLY